MEIESNLEVYKAVKRFIVDGPSGGGLERDPGEYWIGTRMVYASDYDALAAELQTLRSNAYSCPQCPDHETRIEQLEAELAALKRTREQEADYAETCYQNGKLRDRVRELEAENRWLKGAFHRGAK